MTSKHAKRRRAKIARRRERREQRQQDLDRMAREMFAGACLAHRRVVSLRVLEAGRWVNLVEGAAPEPLPKRRTTGSFKLEIEA